MHRRWLVHWVATATAQACRARCSASRARWATSAYPEPLSPPHVLRASLVPRNSWALRSARGFATRVIGAQKVAQAALSTYARTDPSTQSRVARATRPAKTAPTPFVATTSSGRASAPSLLTASHATPAPTCCVRPASTARGRALAPRTVTHARTAQTQAAPRTNTGRACAAHRRMGMFA